MRPQRAEPAWLTELAGAADRHDAVARFWESLASSPVIGTVTERDGRPWCEVTFVWQQPRTDVEVMVHVNGITDDMRDDVAASLLVQLAGTDLWHLSWWLPADGLWGYRVVEMPRIPRDAGRSREGWLQVHRAGRLDPRNPAWLPHVLGEASSVVVLPAAYQHPAWTTPPVPLEQYRHLETVPFGEPGSRRTVHHWRPLRGGTVATVVLFDAEQWAPLGLADAVASARLQVDLLLIDSLDLKERARDLPDPERAAALVAAALDAHADTTGRACDPARTIVAGQSYGGLAAAGVVLHRPDLARTAIAQSGSFWHGIGVPPTRDSLVPGDLTRALADGSLGSPPVRLALHAGTDEGSMVPQARLLEEACRGRGIDAETTVVTGGHDFAWWRHHLLRELENLLPALPR